MLLLEAACLHFLGFIALIKSPSQPHATWQKRVCWQHMRNRSSDGTRGFGRCTARAGCRPHRRTRWGSCTRSAAPPSRCGAGLGSGVRVAACPCALSSMRDIQHLKRSYTRIRQAGFSATLPDVLILAQPLWAGAVECSAAAALWQISGPIGRQLPGVAGHEAFVSVCRKARGAGRHMRPCSHGYFDNVLASAQALSNVVVPGRFDNPEDLPPGCSRHMLCAKP